MILAQFSIESGSLPRMKSPLKPKGEVSEANLVWHSQKTSSRVKCTARGDSKRSCKVQPRLSKGRGLLTRCGSGVSDMISYSKLVLLSIFREKWHLGRSLRLKKHPWLLSLALDAAILSRPKMKFL